MRHPPMCPEFGLSLELSPTGLGQTLVGEIVLVYLLVLEKVQELEPLPAEVTLVEDVLDHLATDDVAVALQEIVVAAPGNEDWIDGSFV